MSGSVIHRLLGKVRPAWFAPSAAIVLLLALYGQPAFGAACAAKSKSSTVIVLDAGHTPTTPGATSARGVTEYDFNVNLARRVRDELVQSGYTSTHLMLTTTDGEAGLRERADRANAWGADLFLSLHHDSVQERYLVPWFYNNEQHLYYDDSTGFSLHVSPGNPQFGDSMRLARLLGDQLLSRGLTPNLIHETSVGAGVPLIDRTRAIYRRNLAVEIYTTMPAVLLEAGVIVNRAEELRVATPAYQSLIAGAVTAAVEKFCGSPDTTVYRVVNVAADDVLNIRSGPGANLGIVGTIPPNGRGVRMVGSCSGQWCQINYRGTAGWVNRQYLANEP